MSYTEKVEVFFEHDLFEFIKDPNLLENHDIYTVGEFRKMCNGYFIDYDGYGHPIKDGYKDPSKDIYPSQANRIPEDATHIEWYFR